MVVNRYFTAYMTLKRLLVVAFPLRFRHTGVSEQRHLRDALLHGVLMPLALLGVVAFVSSFCFDDDDEVDADVRFDKIWLLLTFGLSFATIVVTMIAAGKGLMNVDDIWGVLKKASNQT